MWLFSKDSSSTKNSVGFNFQSDPIPGFSISSDDSGRSFSFAAPYRLEWILQKATNRKKPGECVSVFSLRVPTSGMSPMDTEMVSSSIRQTVKWMKTLRHPNILNWMAGTDLSGPKISDQFYIATEYAIPLREYLRTKADSGNFNFISSWGIHQISHALAFLNDEAKIAHNAVRLDAIFVATSGEWKLGGLDFAGPVNEPPPDSRATASFALASPGGADPYIPPDNCLTDPWGLGCLIWEIFNPDTSLRDRAQLTSSTCLQRFPKSLVLDYRRLVAPNARRGAKRRCTVAQFLEQSRNPDKEGFFANPYVDTLLFLEEIQLKDAKEKTQFLASLSDKVANFPEDVCRNKILPHLLNGLRYGSAGIEALIPVLRLIPLLSETEFQSDVLPCLIQLFASPERATRVRLLDQLPNFVKDIPPKVIEKQIFTSVATGFSDVNPVVREATVRAMIHLAPKLPSKMLNDTLPRYLIGVQTKDDQGGIRTNAVICLAKLATSFSTQVQQGVLLNAFLRATRDQFTPCRKASLAALGATQHLYKTDQLAGKLLPCLSFLTVDPDKSVRDDAFRIIRDVLDHLEQMSENPAFQNSTEATEATSSSESQSTVSHAAAAALSNLAWSALSFSSRLITSSRNPKATEQSQPASIEVKMEQSGKAAGDKAASTSHIPRTSDASAKPGATGSKPMSLKSKQNDLEREIIDATADGDEQTANEGETDGWDSLDVDPALEQTPMTYDWTPVRSNKLDWDADAFLDSITAHPAPRNQPNRVKVTSRLVAESHPRKSSPPSSKTEESGWDDW